MVDSTARGGKRVKWYVMNSKGKWDDRGTGHVRCKNSASVLQIHFQREDSSGPGMVIPVQNDTDYQLQGKTIISWTDKSLDPQVSLDMALSFAEPSGCSEVWDRICLAQSPSATANSSNADEFMKASARAGSSARHGDSALVNSSEDPKAQKMHENTDSHWSTGDVSDDAFTDSANMMMLAASASPLVASSIPQEGYLAKFVMPTPDKDGLNDLARTLTDPTLMQKNTLRERILSELCAGNYISRLCALFLRSEKEGDVETLSKLYSIMRSICMFGNHPVIEVLANQANIMQVVGCLEYDPMSIAKTSHSVDSGHLQAATLPPAAGLDNTVNNAMDTTTAVSEIEKKTPKTDAKDLQEHNDRGNSSTDGATATGKSTSEVEENHLFEDNNSVPKATEDANSSKQAVSPCVGQTGHHSNPSDLDLQRDGQLEDASANSSMANTLQLPGSMRPCDLRASTLSSGAPRCPGTPRPSGLQGPCGPSSVVPEIPGTPRPAVLASKSAAPTVLSTPRPIVPSLKELDGDELQRAAPLSSCRGVGKMPGTPRPDVQFQGITEIPELHNASRHVVLSAEKSSHETISEIGNSSDCDPRDSLSSPAGTVKGTLGNTSNDDILSSNVADKAYEMDDAPKMNLKFRPLRKHRDFLESKVSFKAVAKISSPDVVAKIHQNFQVAYVKDVVLGRAMDDCYNNTLGTLVNCNNEDILLYFLNNCVSIRDLYQKVEGLFKMRAKKRSASENLEKPKSPKRARVSSSASSEESNESARSVQQVPGDDACPMETDAQSGDNTAVLEKDNNHAVPSAVIIQDISDAISFSVQLCEVSRNQEALRPQFYAMLRSCGALNVCLLALKDKLASIRLLGSNFLSIIAMQDYCELRTYIANAEKNVNDGAGARKFCSRVPSTSTGGIHLRSVRTPAVTQSSKAVPSSIVGASKSTEASAVAQTSAPSAVEIVTQNFSSKMIEREESNSGAIDNNSAATSAELPVSVPDNRNELKCSEPNIEEEDATAAQECIGDKTPPCVQGTVPSALSVVSSVASEKSLRQMKQDGDELPGRKPINQMSRNAKGLSRCEANRLYPLLSTIVDVVCDDEDIGVVLQLIDLLRGLLDPTTMRVDVTRDLFVDIFYSHFVNRLLEPIIRAWIRCDDTADKRKAGQDENVPYLCDFLSYSVANHSFIVKYFVLTHDVGGKMAKLLRHRKKYIRLSGLRFLRTCIAMRDKAYDDYLLRNNLLEPVMEMYRQNSHGDNLISSAVLDLVDYLTRANRKVLLEAVIEKYSDILEPSKVLCSTFEMAKAALRNTKSDRGQGSGPIASDTSLIHDLALAADGRLELNGVDHMVSMLTTQADNNVPFESSSGRMNILGSDLRLPSIESGDAGFSVSDELYSSFPDLLEEKDTTGPLAMSASDMWLENTTAEPGLHENHDRSLAKEEVRADSGIARENHDDARQRKTGEQHAPQQDWIEKSSTQVDTKSDPAMSAGVSGFPPNHLRAQEHSSLQNVRTELTIQSQKKRLPRNVSGISSKSVESDDYESAKGDISKGDLDCASKRPRVHSPQADTLPRNVSGIPSESVESDDYESAKGDISKGDLDCASKQPRVHSPQADTVSEEDVSGSDDGASSQSLVGNKRPSPTRNENASDAKKRRKEDVGIS